MVLCGISTCFQVLSPCLGQIVHALLTRPPLEYQPSGRSFPIGIPARLACVKHAASVRPEPGSNSYVQSLPCFLPSTQPLAKAADFPDSSRRFTLSESDFLFFLQRNRFRFGMTLFLFSVSFSRFATVSLSGLCAAVVTTLMIIANFQSPVNPFFDKLQSVNLV